MKGRKRLYQYEINGYYVEIHGRYFNGEYYEEPTLIILKSSDSSVIHLSNAKNVKTLKNRMRKHFNINDINKYSVRV